MKWTVKPRIALTMILCVSEQKWKQKGEDDVKLRLATRNFNPKRSDK